uniref:Uncharacterized protein n=1 Tax=Mycena chlorophos TaxID=658473 RepID=A0ABQ0KYD0_MYCCL|nr:predicted protein [Mycena chlorophos]
MLNYRDPVWDSILGYMHNWLEGILEYQLRALWGMGYDSQRKRALAELDTADDDDDWTDTDMSEAEQDLADLHSEQADFDPSEFEQWKAQYIASFSETDDDDEIAGGSTPRAAPGSRATSVPETQMDVDEDDVATHEFPDEFHEDANFEDAAVTGFWKFSKDRVNIIQQCITHM